MIVNCPACGPVEAQSPEEFEATLMEAMMRPIEVRDDDGYKPRERVDDG